MSEIEAEIRRQMLEQRDRALQDQTPPPSGAGPGAPPPGGYELPPPTDTSGPSFQALPPPAFPPAGSAYPPHYPQNPYQAPPPPSYPGQSPPPGALPPPRSAPASSAPKSPPRKGLLGGMGAIGLALAKFWGAIKGLLVALKFLTFGKYIVTALSMLATIALYSALFGWRFAVGIVLLIFVHEAGHALAIKRLGYQVTAMVFVPFLGAYVTRDQIGDPAERAQIAIMGPVAGTVAGLVCGSVYGATGSPIWLVLSFFSFYINLFNLGGFGYLDGGRVVPLIPAKVLLGGLLLTLAINWRFPICWLVVLFSLPQITERWRYGVDPALKVSKQDQQIYTVAYLGLVLFLGFASLTTQSWIWELGRLGRRY